MKSIIFISTIISIISINWTIFTSDDGGFSILSPQDLELQMQTLKTDLGEVQYHKYTYQEQDSSAQVFLYAVSYYAYPTLHIPEDSTEMVNRFFDETLTSIAGKIKGEMVYSNSTLLKDKPAKLTRIEYNDGQYVLKNKLVLSDNKFYLIEVFSTIDGSLNAEVNKFIESFTLL